MKADKPPALNDQTARPQLSRNICSLPARIVTAADLSFSLSLPGRCAAGAGGAAVARATWRHALRRDMPETPHLNGFHAPEESVDAPFAVGFVHRVRFTSNAFDPGNAVLAESIESDGGPARALFVLDSGVDEATPELRDRIAAYAAAHSDRIRHVGQIMVVPGGERAKNDQRVFETVARAISDHAICRRSYVIAIGGGAMLDAVGYAAAAAHRGVRLIRLPTTTLAQDDAGVGVKNGINAFGKKNFLGSFSPPWAVINDDVFLKTLSERDWRSGLSEAVKVALIKDDAFFRQIRQLAPRLRARDQAALAPIVKRSAELHLNHIVAGGDPFELSRARPLDFGHWAAHRLESMTNYRLRHGEAVAIGLAIDVTYSHLSGWLSAADAKAVLDCLTAIGFTLQDTALADQDALLKGLEEFREHLGGQLTITLLKGIARPVDVHEIDRKRMIQAIEHVAASVVATR